MVLLENVDVNFEDTPLEAAIDQLAELADIDIRLDVPALRAANVREREVAGWNKSGIIQRYAGQQ